MALTQIQVSQLYVCIFGRASEGEGNTYWQTDQDTMAATASVMLATDDAKTYFGTSLDADQAFIEYIYENTLGKTYEQDPEGVDYWVTQLTEGTSRGQVVADMITAAQTTDNAGAAQDQFNNRVDVSNHSADTIATADVSDLSAFIEFISSVTDDEQTVEDAKAAVDAYALPESFNLTVESAAGATVMRLTGDMGVRIDLTENDNQVTGLDLDGDGTIAQDGLENDNPITEDDGIDFQIIDAYARNPLNQGDIENNFLGDIAFDGTGFDGDGVSTDGNIFLGGLGVDTAYGGIGNDFLAGGGVAADRFVIEYDSATGTFVARDTLTDVLQPNLAAFNTQDNLSGGRNADFFFASLSELDPTDGDNLSINGGSTSDDSAAGNNTNQDSDWLLLEASDDDEPVTINLANEVLQDFATVTMQEIENVDASGNLYGFLDDISVTIGEGGGEAHTQGTPNVAYGASAQLDITGSVADNILIGGFDNDLIDGGAGDDILMGGNLAYNNNPNTQNIVNNGIDELRGGTGDDDIVFETDGGIYEGGAIVDVDNGESDTLWLTANTLGTETAADVISDGVMRLDLGAGMVNGIDNFAGYGGADQGGTVTDFTADQTNYVEDDAFAQVQDFENIITTGLGNIDFLAAGTNDPDLTFNNQQNFSGLEGVNLDLRGTDGNNLSDVDGNPIIDNILYANTGHDVLEGRGGNDNLMGGDGNDNFIFQLDGDGNGDDLNTIHRQQDSDGDNLWDTDENENELYMQDFGLDEDITTGSSTLNLSVEETDNIEAELANITVTEITSVLRDAGGDIGFTLDTPAIRAADTYADLLTAIQEAIAADADIAATLSASLVDTTIVISDSQGRELADTSPDAIFGLSANNVEMTVEMDYGVPPESTSEDRLIFASYEDRIDGELVDDDGEVNSTGDAVTLGGDGYAEDLVVRFDADENGTTILAEDQAWNMLFDNLADEDTVNVSVNGTAFNLQMGVAADGTAIVETMAGFLQRLTDLINAGSDNDTLAGTLVAGLNPAGDTITLTQGNYNGGQVVFMDEPVVDLGNASGGEPASVIITNNADSEITLFEFDGRHGNLDVDNVLFLGGSGMNEGVVTNADNSRSILETATDAGGELNGSDALILDSMTDADTVVTDFALHGDDLIFTGIGDDVISTGTGDDTIYGSVGTDTVDGGKDIYVIQTLEASKIVEATEIMNEYDADQRADDAGVVDVSLIEQDAWDDPQAGYADTLVFSTADFSGTLFTITVDDDLQQQDGGAGTVGVDEGDDGVINHVTTFTEMEAIRTLAGDGTHAGQGYDTLDVEDLSDAVAASETGDPDAAVVYNMTSELGFIQINADLNDDDEINDDPDQNPNNADTVDENDTFLAVDGVERFIGGNANEQLNIDESEVIKDNYFDGANEVTLADDDDAETIDDPDLVGDSIVYDHRDMDNDGAADDDGVIDTDGNGIILPNDFTDSVAVSMRPSVEIVVESDTETDLVNMTGGTIVGSDVTVDTLVDVETIDISNAAISATLDDTINVSAGNINGAYVDYTDGQVRESDGDVLARITGMTEMEIVLGGAGNDTVQVADTMTNYRAFDADDATTAISYDSFLSYDTVQDVTGDRQTLSQIAVADRPEANNQALFTFDLAAGDDRVDYSLETGSVAAVVNLNAEEASQTVFVMGADLDVADATDRIDLLLNTDEIVASQGISILDFTGAAQDMQITFQYDENNAIASLDRMESVIRIADGDGDTITGISNYVEFYDTDNDDDVAAFANATWNNIQGSDLGETVFYDGSEDLVNDSGLDHRFTVDTLDLRGGDNVVSYTALETSITAVVTVVESDADSVVDMTVVDGDVDYTTGSIVATITFQDGDGGVLAGGGVHNISSYTSDNDVAAGTLKLEASQDAEDTVTFASGSDKLFILGTSAGVLDVKIGDLDAMRLTGFEILQDADSDDVYQFDSMITGLTYTDNPAADTDTIAVNNNAIGYDGLPAPQNDDLDLNEFTTGVNIDFDIMDVTAVTTGSVDLVGSSAADGATGIQDETVVLNDMSLFDNITEFETIKLGAGTSITGTLDVNMTTTTLSDSANSINIDNSVNTLDFSDMTTDTTVEVTSAGPFTIMGGSGDDYITGGAGVDIISGGAGNDTIDPGEATEVRQFNFYDSLATDGNNATFDFMGQGNLTLAEGLDFEDGAGNDAVGTAVANQLKADLTGATADFQAVSGGTEVITDVSYDDATDLLTFTFESGVNVAQAIDLGYVPHGDTGDFTISAEDTLTQGGTGGDNFFYGGAGVDTLTGGGADDTFVVVGTVDAADYAAGAAAGHDAANFADAVTAIENGQAVSDVSTDSYDGGAGTDTLEIWGDADFTDATLENIETYDINSNVTFTAEQLEDINIVLNDPDSALYLEGVEESLLTGESTVEDMNAFVVVYGGSVTNAAGETPGDTTPPALTGTTPVDDAIDVAVGANLVLTFNEDVVAGPGNFRIANAADGTTFEIIAAVDATFVDNTVTLDPVAELVAETEYNVLVQPTAVEDTSGNPFAGISDDSFSFTTVAEGVDIVPPELLSTIPADNAPDVAVDANLVLTFNEEVVAGTGNFRIADAVDDSTFAIIAAESDYATFVNNTVTLDPVEDLAAETEYNVYVQNTAVEDTSGNPFAGISDESFSFTTVEEGVVVTVVLDEQNGTQQTHAELDAADGAMLYTDDAIIQSFVDIINFSDDDAIEFSNAIAEDVIVGAGLDTTLTINYEGGGTVSMIVLIGVETGLGATVADVGNVTFVQLLNEIKQIFQKERIKNIN